MLTYYNGVCSRPVEYMFAPCGNPITPEYLCNQCGLVAKLHCSIKNRCDQTIPMLLNAIKLQASSICPICNIFVGWHLQSYSNIFRERSKFATITWNTKIDANNGEDDYFENRHNLGLRFRKLN